MQPYKKLFTFWYTVIIYDLTVEFTKRFFLSKLGNLSHLGGRPDYRMADQMNGAARSGKQNVVEGSEALATSLKMGIKLTNVAKASLEEAIGDLEDFLRQRGLAAWDKAHPQVRRWRAQSARLVRNLSDLSSLRLPASQAEEKQRKLLSQLPLPEAPEKAANLLLTLCHQATYLLDRQVKSLEEKHETEGGYTEKLYWKRTQYRNRT